VETRYDGEGRPLRVERWSEADVAGVGRIATRWAYDAAGRKVVEIAPDATPADTATFQMSDAEFVDQVRGSATVVADRMSGDIYPYFGFRNSNNFVYTTIAEAGGRVPYQAIRNGKGWGSAPGLCGGLTLGSGHNCSGMRAIDHLFESTFH
jgi:hypothetical protein